MAIAAKGMATVAPRSMMAQHHSTGNSHLIRGGLQVDHSSRQPGNVHTAGMPQKMNYGQMPDGRQGVIDTTNPTPDDHVPFINRFTGDGSRQPPQNPNVIDTKGKGSTTDPQKPMSNLEHNPATQSKAGVKPNVRGPISRDNKSRYNQSTDSRQSKAMAPGHDIHAPRASARSR